MGWQRDLYQGLRPLLFAADAEWVHGLTLTALRKAAEGSWGRAALARAGGGSAPGWTEQPVERMGLRFRNRVGLGAGMDKPGTALVGWGALGMGFAEVGTATHRPQPGNPRPRVWRLERDAALVNRMGFNNPGAGVVADNVARARPWLPAGFVVGASIGRGVDTPDSDAEADYLAAARTLAPVADYLALNVSSPNTAGLGSLAEPDRLAGLVRAVAEVEPRRPLVVKLSADLDAPDLLAAVRALADAPAAGLILSNTSRHRDGLRSSLPSGAEAGGLSGAPLLEPMLAAVAAVRAATADRFTLIGSGGILSGADGARAVSAGADLVQLWTGLVYAGPGLIGEAVEAVTSRPI